MNTSQQRGQDPGCARGSAEASEQILNVSFHGGILLFNKPVKSLRHIRRGICHRFHRAVARNARQVLPVWRGKRVRVLHRVGFSRFGLKREHEIVAKLGRRENCRRRPDPKAALNGKTRAAGHSGQRLGDGASQLKPRTAAEGRAATGNHTARNGEPAAALGERRYRTGNEQEQKKGFHRRGWYSR